MLKWMIGIFHATWSVLTFLPRWLYARLFLAKEKTYRISRVADLPESPMPSIFYVAGEGSRAWGAAILCPCGCGDRIDLNLLKQVRPCWAFEEHPDGTVSVMPSVWRQKGCRSHFFVRRGKIDWC
jgi:hypothetical protein